MIFYIIYYEKILFCPIRNSTDKSSSTTEESNAIIFKPIKNPLCLLLCIDTPELKGKKVDLIRAKAARDYLNDLITGSTVNVRRTTKDRYGRTVAELFEGPMNIQKHLVEKDFVRIYKRDSSQYQLSKK